MTEGLEEVKLETDKYIKFKEPFALDERMKFVCKGDEVCFIEKGELHTRKVWDIRNYNGKNEVKVCGANGGWKREFYKLA